MSNVPLNRQCASSAAKGLPSTNTKTPRVDRPLAEHEGVEGLGYETMKEKKGRGKSREGKNKLVIYRRDRVGMCVVL